MLGHRHANHCTSAPLAPLPWEEGRASWFRTSTWACPEQTIVRRLVKENQTMTLFIFESTVALPHLGEVHVAVGQVLRLVVVVCGVCDARVVLLHRLVLREGRLLSLQLGVHDVAAHQRLGPT